MEFLKLVLSFLRARAKEPTTVLAGAVLAVGSGLTPADIVNFTDSVTGMVTAVGAATTGLATVAAMLMPEAPK